MYIIQPVSNPVKISASGLALSQHCWRGLLLAVEIQPVVIVLEGAQHAVGQESWEQRIIIILIIIITLYKLVTGPLGIKP